MSEDLGEWLNSSPFASDHVELWWLRLGGLEGAQDILRIAHAAGRLQSIHTPRELVEHMAHIDARRRCDAVKDIFLYALRTL